MRDVLADPVTRTGDVINAPGHPFDGASVVFSYTRADAIADGVLHSAMNGEIGSISARFFGALNVAMTDSVSTILGDAEGKNGATAAGFWSDILTAAKDSPSEKWHDRHFADLVIPGRTKPQTFVVHCGPGDRGEPVITVMLPGED